MGKPLLLILAVLLTQLCLPQSSEHDGEIMQIKGKWTKNKNIIGLNDPELSQKQYSFAFKKTDSASALLKQAYPNPIGLEAFYDASIGGWPLFKGAPAAYTLRSFYKSYYFNRHLKKILLIDETATAVRINFNRFGPLLKEQGEWMIDGQMTKVFAPLEVEGQWKSFTRYKKDQWQAGNQSFSRTLLILVSREGELPFIPVTQKQYLLALKNFLEKSKQQFPNASTTYYDEKIKIIDQYLSNHSEQEIQQPAVTSRLWDFGGHFGPEGKKQLDYPVLINPAYFKKNLPRYSPQFIVMEWSWENDAPGLEFFKQFEGNFPLQKLKAMIDQ